MTSANVYGVEMVDDERPPQRKVTYEVGMALDTLSAGDFDECIGWLEAEIVRLRAAKAQKQAALLQAGSVFKTG